jgi:hypothetical protein
VVAGSRLAGPFQWQGFVVLWFIVEKKTRGPATATLCYHYSNYYMASVCFRQPIRQAFSCCHRGMATVFATLLAISIHRIERLYVSHFEDWRRVAPVDTWALTSPVIS